MSNQDPHTSLDYFEREAVTRLSGGGFLRRFETWMDVHRWAEDWAKAEALSRLPQQPSARKIKFHFVWGFVIGFAVFVALSVSQPPRVSPERMFLATFLLGESLMWMVYLLQSDWEKERIAKWWSEHPTWESDYQRLYSEGLYAKWRAVEEVISQARTRQGLCHRIAGLTGRQFELWVAELLVRDGWQAQATQSTRDNGIDVIATRGPRTLLVQCKHWPSGSVGRPDLQRFHGAFVEARVNNGTALFVASGRLTQGARDAASGFGILTVEDQGLLDWGLGINRPV